tara:strand:+ start:29354 stop:30202 length:849 start_codon:yes stop_codon:yes gene_type:complete
MNRFLVFVIFICFQSTYAQDLLSMLEIDDNEVQLTTSIFKDNRIVNAQSSKQTSKGEFKFLIQHRFGTLNSGFYSLWGIDNSHVRFGLDYGVSERLALALGRSSNGKQYDASAKLNILQQTNLCPLVLSTYSAIFFAHPSDNDRQQPDYDLLNQFSFSNQLIIARKFTSELSLVLLPTHIHLNRFFAGTSADPLFMGVGGRYKVTKKVSVNGEYFYALSPMTELHQNMLSVGVDIETGGHVFSLHLSNSRGMNEQAFLTQTTGQWLEGDIYFGFNISRVFSW